MFFFLSLLCQDAISATNPRVIDDARARKLSNDLKRSTYYETCSTYGLNVERVFQDGETPKCNRDETSEAQILQKTRSQQKSFLPNNVLSVNNTDLHIV